MTLTKEFIDRTAKFLYYRDGELWYELYPVYEHKANENGYVVFATEPSLPAFKFPVPIKDTGSGIFKAEHKGVELMRWIRKHLETEAKWYNQSKSEGKS